jgi:hypothetical protein
MPTDSKSKKPAPAANESEVSNVQPDPDGFLSELEVWGTKPNPASFEKLLETNREKFALALSQGYSAEDICRLAGSYGIKVQASTFRKYWQRLNAKSERESDASEAAAGSSAAAPKVSNKPDSTASTKANSAVNF